MQDEDAVNEMLRRQHRDDDKSVELGFLGWTPERDLLTTICDVLQQIHATLVQVNSENGQRPDVKPMVRPRGVIEKVEAKQALIDHRERVKLLTPHLRQ